MNTRSKQWVKIVPYIVGAIFVVLSVFLAVYLKSFVKTEAKPKRQIQQITIIKPPPTPPPPPEMKQPEKQEKVAEDTPDKPKPADAPKPDPGDEPAIGKGTQSGLQLGRRGRVGLGGGGGGKYFNVIKTEVNKALLRDKHLRSEAYEAVVTLWLNDDGSFKHFKIDLITGDQSTKTQLTRFFDQLARIDKPKPIEEKANRFRFRITSVI